MKQIFFFCLIFLSIKVSAQSDNYNWSFKFGGGPYSKLINGGSTYNWYGNPEGSEIFAGLGYNNIIFNCSYRYFDQVIKTNLPYNNTMYYLPKGATVRMVFWNLSVSYEKELGNRFFVEPTIGFLKNYTMSNIKTLQDQEFDIKDLYGVTVGSNMIKYIKFFKEAYLGIYLNLNYNFINYKLLNPGLKNNSLGYSLGVVLKGTNEKKKKFKVDDGYDPTGL